MHREDSNHGHLLPLSLSTSPQDKLVSSSFYFSFFSSTKLQLHMKNKAAARVFKWYDKTSYQQRHQQPGQEQGRVFNYFLLSSATRKYYNTPEASQQLHNNVRERKYLSENTSPLSMHVADLLTGSDSCHSSIASSSSNLLKMSVLAGTSSCISRMKIPVCQCPPQFVSVRLPLCLPVWVQSR